MANSVLDRILATFFKKNTTTRAGNCVPGRKRFLTGAALTAALLVGGAVAAQTLPTFTVGASDGSTSVVGFGGYQWYVIQDDGGGVVGGGTGANQAANAHGGQRPD